MTFGISIFGASIFWHSDFPGIYFMHFWNLIIQHSIWESCERQRRVIISQGRSCNHSNHSYFRFRGKLFLSFSRLQNSSRLPLDGISDHALMRCSKYGNCVNRSTSPNGFAPTHFCLLINWANSLSELRMPAVPLSSPSGICCPSTRISIHW